MQRDDKTGGRETQPDEKGITSGAQSVHKVHKRRKQRDMGNRQPKLKCFIASAFGQKDVDDVYTHAIVPVCRRTS